MDAGAQGAVPPLQDTMKRVLLVVPGLGVGGVERSLLALLKLAPLTRLDITLLTFVPGGELSGEVPSGVRLACDRRAGRMERLRGAVSGALKARGLHRLFRALKQAYHRLGGAASGAGRGSQGYDVAIAYADGLATWYVAQHVAAACKIAFVHTDIVQAGYNIQTERRAYAGYRWIFFGSASSRSRFLSQMPELAEKAKLLPNTVDALQIKHMAELGAPFAEGGPYIKIVTVGRLSHEKGVSKIPKLLQMLQSGGSKVVWYVVGDGPERQKLMRCAQELGVETALVLVGAQKNPYPYIRGCDIYVQPSDYEGYCIALAEARMLCRPIVACCFAGAEDQIVDGKTGYVTGMAPEDIFPALCRLVDDPAQRARFTEALAGEAAAREGLCPAVRWWEWVSTL